MTFTLIGHSSQQKPHPQNLVNRPQHLGYAKPAQPSPISGTKKRPEGQLPDLKSPHLSIKVSCDLSP